MLWLGSKATSYTKGIHNQLRQLLLQLVDKKVGKIAHEPSTILDDENCHHSENKKNGYIVSTFLCVKNITGVPALLRDYECIVDITDDLLTGDVP